MVPKYFLAILKCINEDQLSISASPKSHIYFKRILFSLNLKKMQPSHDQSVSRIFQWQIPTELAQIHTSTDSSSVSYYVSHCNS